MTQGLETRIKRIDELNKVLEKKMKFAHKCSPAKAKRTMREVKRIQKEVLGLQDEQNFEFWVEELENIKHRVLNEDKLDKCINCYNKNLERFKACHMFQHLGAMILSQTVGLEAFLTSLQELDSSFIKNMANLYNRINNFAQEMKQQDTE